MARGSAKQELHQYGKDFNHPECQDGEEFRTHMTEKNFKELHKRKPNTRLGKDAYHIASGEKYDDDSKFQQWLFPVFEIVATSRRGSRSISSL